ncbi:MAG: C_GCAxxG_C_C family protein [Clostridiales bacterium]|nr:C_GCAxxG_C_C family protein [Candidatus Crickella merdequi]
MDINVIQDLFMRDAGCGQIVAGEFAEETGLAKETLWKMAASFDGGMMRGETCGAVIAAYNVIGLIAGHDGPEQLEQKGEMLRMTLLFNEKFLTKRKSFVCKEILGADITTADGMDQIINGGLMMNVCPVVINEVIEALKETIVECKEEA